MTQNPLSPILNQALASAWYQLGQFASNEILFSDAIATAFGAGADASQFQAAWAKSDFSGFPPIEVRRAAEINGANGAFAAATGKIYLSQEFIDANVNNVEAITAVLLEEYGHYVDSQINLTDSAGDEGDIFARLVRGESIGGAELAVLKAEDDSAIVMLDGQAVAIEQNTVTGAWSVYWTGGPFGTGTYWTNKDNSGTIGGTGGHDWIWADGGDDTIAGHGGDDSIGGASGNDKIWGGTGNDRLHGGSYEDQLFGESGDDHLYGDDGFDYLEGGSDNDLLYGGNHNDILLGETGNDLLYGDNDQDELYGGSGDDTLYGGWGLDYLQGGSGNDKLHGGGHDDTLVDYEGSNFLDGGFGFDKVNYENSPHRIIVGKNQSVKEDYYEWGTGKYNEYYDAEVDLVGGENSSLRDVEEIIGSVGNDELYAYGYHYWNKQGMWVEKRVSGELYSLRGGDGNDQLFALADRLNEGQHNRLFGDAGNDILSADISKDSRSHTLYGGSGFDTFILSASTQNTEATSSGILTAVRDIGINALGFIPGIGSILSFIGSTTATLYDTLSEQGNIPGSGDDLVYIEDFTFGEDVLVLPELVGQEGYNFQRVANENAFFVQVQNNGVQNIAKVKMTNWVDNPTPTDLTNFLGKSIKTSENDYTVADVVNLDYSTNNTGFTLNTQNTNDVITGLSVR